MTQRESSPANTSAMLSRMRAYSLVTREAEESGGCVPSSIPSTCTTASRSMSATVCVSTISCASIGVKVEHSSVNSPTVARRGTRTWATVEAAAGVSTRVWFADVLGSPPLQCSGNSKIFSFVGWVCSSGCQHHSSLGGVGSASLTNLTYLQQHTLAHARTNARTHVHAADRTSASTAVNTESARNYLV